MERLISLREYVLRFDKPIGFYADQLDYYEGQSNAMSCVISYANLLSQKLELWMFVPCKLVEGVWVVLEEPKDWKNWQDVYIANNTEGKTKDRYTSQLSARWDCQEYQEAKLNCLFKGFSIDKEFPNVVMHKSGWSLSKRDLHLCTIETYANNGYNLELTPTAKKQIGL